MASPLSETATEPLALTETFRQLPALFHENATPTPTKRPQLLRLNRALADDIGFDAGALTGPDGIATLAGNRTPADVTPLAMAYAGHQFGNLVPTLGDGRAVLLGERVDTAGVRRDIQLKGAGITPFSRTGDGRAALGPVLREYIVSEAMAGLGVPTTRALAATSTGENVLRPTPEPGAILTRVATSHIRVGTFEYAAKRGETEAVQALADYVIERHYPEIADAEAPYRALIEAVAERTGTLIANWLLVGFIHGVMNTDNVSIAGETLDYGPCAFMDTYDPATVYSSIDSGGRYAYNQQPRVGLWNLSRFAECLLPLLADDQDEAVSQAKEALDAYGNAFETAYHGGLVTKIGLAECHEGDVELASNLLQTMAEQSVDFTLGFRYLADAAHAVDSTNDTNVRALFADPTAFDGWATRWRERLATETRGFNARRNAMRAVNPAFIPRNHRVQQVIDAATNGDLEPLNELLAVVSQPFDDHPNRAHYAEPPAENEKITRTFCGT
ncbi:YdiU family protein [Salinisphaera sp. USBA-960]|uniref:protein adenylyltransferase SelO n=1 Tax=Salinisphaera orenii TaxID=856731 RepID=UPI000DBE5BF0|nr:YdiU family protein [Salifodinibacter halophilus]NNC27259.1 YdiU family protein [Salifodinibacter halophilus]